MSVQYQWNTLKSDMKPCVTHFQMTNFSPGLILRHLENEIFCVMQKLKIVMSIVQNIVGKGENASYHVTSIFPFSFSVFLNFHSSGLLKPVIVC